MPLTPARQKYVPKHRHPRVSYPGTLGRHAQRTVVRNAAVLSTAAVAVTGVTVAGGINAGQVAASSSPLSAAVDNAGSTIEVEPFTQAELESRAEAIVSRSDSRERTDPTKAAVLDQTQGGALTRNEDLSDAAPRDIARALLPQYGFSADQFSCLDQLYISESNWRVDADNPISSAYGIPQALTSMHDLPADYMTSAEAQIRWGLDYIADSYGSPCSAWSFKQAHNWY